MEQPVFAWLSGLSVAGQVALIVFVILVFREQIAERIFGPKQNEKNGIIVNIGEDLPEKPSKEWFDGIVEINQGLGEQIQTLIGMMSGLTKHYNHDTTELLGKISDGIGKLITKNEEWEKYGIPTRECREKRVQ